MTTQARVRKMVTAVVLGITVAVVACGSQDRATGSATGGPIEIEISQLFIHVINRSGTAITDVKLELVPIGRATIFSATHYRLESEGRQSFSMNDLRGSDGTPFRRSVHRPQTVRVTANGVDGTAHELEIPWD